LNQPIVFVITRGIGLSDILKTALKKHSSRRGINMHSLGLLLQGHIDSIRGKLVITEAPDIKTLSAVVLPKKDYALFEAVCSVVSEVLMPSLLGCTMRLKLSTAQSHGFAYFQYSIVFNRHLDFQRLDQQDALVALARMAKYTSRHSTLEVSLDNTNTELLLIVEASV
jgi:hypothetical protein